MILLLSSLSTKELAREVTHRRRGRAGEWDVGLSELVKELGKRQLGLWYQRRLEEGGPSCT